LFFLLLFALLRGAFWGRRWGWGGRGIYGYHGRDLERGEIPTPVKEWHRRLHEEDSTPPTPPAAGAA
jgi:hypothetical protein